MLQVDQEARAVGAVGEALVDGAEWVNVLAQFELAVRHLDYAGALARRRTIQARGHWLAML